jgi:hypothetical protein
MVPKDHPLRVIRPLMKAALARLSPEFERLYAPAERASIAPEKLLTEWTARLLVDSTGLKLCGPGEWLAERHGARRRSAATNG